MVIDYFPNGGTLLHVPSPPAPGMHHETPYLNMPIPGQAMPANPSEQNYAALQGKSGAEMLSGILAEAERSKRAGTLSNAEIDACYEQFSPMLDDAKRKKLARLAEELKKM